MPTISMVEYERLKRAEVKLEEMKENKLMEKFIGVFTSNLGLLAANLPMDEWPKEFHIAFTNAAADYPVPAHIYQNRKMNQTQS